MLLDPFAVLVAAGVVAMSGLLWALAHSALVYWLSKPGVLSRPIEDEQQ